MRVREMTAADIDDVSALRVRGWQSAYDGLMPRSYLAAMTFGGGRGEATRDLRQGRRRRSPISSPRAPTAAITGWAAFGPYRPQGPHGQGESADGAELYALYALPELIGTGIGRALMSACLDRAVERGFPRILLWVVRGNTRARRFYERAGFTLDGAEDTYDIEGTAVPIVRYVRALVSGPA